MSSHTPSPQTSARPEPFSGADLPDPPPPDALHRAMDAIATLCTAIAGAGLVTLIVIFGWLVFGRYVLNDTPTWVEQLSLILVVWITFLGAAAGVWTHAHLSIDFLRELFPPRARDAMHWLALAGILIFAGVLAWQGAVLAQNTWPRRVPMLGFSEGFRAVPMSICGALSVMFTLVHALDLARGRHVGRD